MEDYIPHPIVQHITSVQLVEEEATSVLAEARRRLPAKEKRVV